VRKKARALYPNKRRKEKPKCCSATKKERKIIPKKLLKTQPKRGGRAIMEEGRPTSLYRNWFYAFRAKQGRASNAKKGSEPNKSLLPKGGVAGPHRRLPWRGVHVTVEQEKQEKRGLP